MTSLARTPCVGRCSTTYGDLVCRGCKRFAHEIVHWNGYPDAQRQRVVERLARLRDESVGRFVAIADRALLLAAARRLRIADGQTDAGLAYHVLRLWPAGGALAACGIAPAPGAPPAPAALRDAVDAEFLLRSHASYESSFKVLIR